MGFSPSITERIMKCVSTTRLAFMINGKAYGDLVPERRVYQGDPLSPFIMCSEVFSSILQDLQVCRKISGVQVARTVPIISHLFFADDSPLLAKADSREAVVILSAIRLYEQASGQMIDYEKYGIYFSPNTLPQVSTNISNILGIPRVSSHAKYLGLHSIIGGT